MDDYIQYVGGTVGVAALTGAAAAAAATAIYMACTPTPMTPPVDINNQSAEIPDSGGARQSRFAPPNGDVTSFIYDDAKTLYEMMHRGCRMSENGPCLGSRGTKPEYTWLTYQEVIDRAYNLASGLINIGMKPGQSTFIGLYSQNSVEWILTEQACYTQSAVIVPLYDTLGPNACSFIINQAEISIVICDKEEKVKSLLAEKSKTPTLKHIIVVNNVEEETTNLAKEKDVNLYSFLKALLW